MNRVLRTYQRDITFFVFEKTINFKVPIITPIGDEFYLDFSVEKENLKNITYKIINTPMSLTIEMPPPDHSCHNDTTR